MEAKLQITQDGDRKSKALVAIRRTSGFPEWIFGAGVTSAPSVCDTSLSQHVRRQYGIMEAKLQMSKMVAGDKLPTSTAADSMNLLQSIWKDGQLHNQAACKTLLEQILLDGFDADHANFKGVAVMERPANLRDNTYISFLDHNLNRSCLAGTTHHTWKICCTSAAQSSVFAADLHDAAPADCGQCHLSLC